LMMMATCQKWHTQAVGAAAAAAAVFSDCVYRA